MGVHRRRRSHGMAVDRECIESSVVAKCHPMRAGHVLRFGVLMTGWRVAMQIAGHMHRRHCAHAWCVMADGVHVPAIAHD